MKTFSRLSSLTLMLLSVAFLLAGSVFYAHAQNAALEVEGEGDHQIGDNVTVSFYATLDGSAVAVPLEIDGAGLSNLMINGNSASFPAIVNTMPALGNVEVTGDITGAGAYVSAYWNRPLGDDDLRARADLTGDDQPAPLVIVVNPPDPKAPLSVGSTFTQKITIENRDATRTSLPLSAWQMDVVYNSLILSAVEVTEGDFLSSDGEPAYYTEQMSSGRIRVSQSRPGHMDNAPMSPDADEDDATASSPGGIALAPGDVGTLLTVQFTLLAVAEEPLGIHNVRLQSSEDYDSLPDLDGDGVPDGVRDRISYSILVTDVAVATQQSTSPVDVNQDGDVNILDLVTVASSIAAVPPNPRADVNGDGFVNVLDLITIYTSSDWAGTVPLADVAQVNEAALAAPSVKRNVGPDTIQSWIDLARIEDDGSAIFDLGIANLEALIASRIPSETRLLLNYPNPFNPETWIPYQLAEATKVTVMIHSMNGSLIRTLELGHQAAGTYKSKSQAAYWDGRNEFGEQVASGLYFYTLTAGDFSATHKMLVRK